MSILESPETYRLLDQSGMIRHLLQFPEECQRAWHNATSFNYPRDYLKVDKVVIAGMGGSAIGGDFVRRLAMLENTLPVWVHRDYGLPPFVDRNTLIIFSSYSGNTEETLSCFNESLRTQAKKMVLTSGGKLKSLAEKERIPVLTIDYEAPPRAAFSHSFLSLLGIFHALRLLQDKSADVKESLAIMKRVQEGASDKTPLESNLAKQLAADFFGRLAVIYGASLLSEVAFRWKTQVNENSKSWAFHEVFPELNHNAVVGYPLPSEIRDKVMVVMLHAPSLHPRISVRYQVTSEILTKAGIRNKRVEAIGRSALAQMIGLVLLGDYVSYYLAMLNRTDPTPVAVIDTLKSRLAQME
ncbi:MAG: bifunctional phosphoglucose/phosphomannose isomerase [Dehalococcoidia bacterium]|nr:bifunctional phosphoglucose/phosphomannose isomerase [Dehalococcoidia bacterium]